MEFKKYSKDNNISYSFGAFPTYELLQNKLEFARAIVVHEKLEDSQDIDKIITLAKNKNIPVITNGKAIEKLSSKGNVYIMGVFEKYPSKLNHRDNQVLLVNPSDMGNLGTIIRVMLGFNYKNLAIIKPCIDVFDPRVIRASMGSVFSVNIELYDSYEDYQKVNNNYKYPFMLQSKNTLQTLEEKKYPHTLIFGNEASGLDKSYLNQGTPLLIEHSNKIDSLNLSMSVGIALYEFNKR